MKRFFFLCIITISVFSFASCNDKKSKNSSNIIKIAGSTSVAPLMKKIKDEFEIINSSQIEIQETGSSAGITATIEKAANIGMSSRELKISEIDKGLKFYTIALDGIAIIVNKENKINNLTKDQIFDIFKGNIKNWKEVGGDDKEIIVVSRESGSGTRGAFDELLDLIKDVKKDIKGEIKEYKQSLVTSEAMFDNSNGAVLTDVATSKYSIGYISLCTINDMVKAVSVDGILCSEDNIKNKIYKISRPFILCINEDNNNGNNDLIDFILSSDGKKIIKENGYINLD